jgi:hypothetical protein
LPARKQVAVTITHLLNAAAAVRLDCVTIPWAIHLSVVLGVAWLQHRCVRPRLESPGTR